MGVGVWEGGERRVGKGAVRGVGGEGGRGAGRGGRRGVAFHLIILSNHSF